jgi:hypothetical protein
MSRLNCNTLEHTYISTVLNYTRFPGDYCCWVVGFFIVHASLSALSGVLCRTGSVRICLVWVSYIPMWAVLGVAFGCGPELSYVIGVGFYLHFQLVSWLFGLSFGCFWGLAGSSVRCYCALVLVKVSLVYIPHFWFSLSLCIYVALSYRHCHKLFVWCVYRGPESCCAMCVLHCTVCFE